MKFLTRLAERNGGEVSVKMGKLLFLKAGQGVTASGKKIPQITITRSDGDRHHFAIADRGAYTGVTAKWLHTKDPKPQKQKVKLKRKKKEKHLRALEHPKAKPVTQKKAPKVPEAREGEYMAGEADNVFALTTVYATKAQAMRAAQAKWDKLQRGVAEFSISLATGRADIYTETPVKVSGFKRVIDEQDWTITKVTHFLNNSGFTTSLVLAMFHCPLCQHAAHARTSRYITDTTKERYHQCQNVNCSATFITYESVQRYIVKPGEVHAVRPHPLPSGQQIMWM